jgi:hypothetical protein
MVPLRAGGSQGGAIQSYINESFSDTENYNATLMDGVGSKICGQNVINKLVGRTLPATSKQQQDYSFFGSSRYSSVSTNTSNNNVHSSAVVHCIDSPESKITTKATTSTTTTTSASSNSVPASTSSFTFEKLTKYLVQPTNTTTTDFFSSSSTNEFTGIDQNQLRSYDSNTSNYNQNSLQSSALMSAPTPLQRITSNIGIQDKSRSPSIHSTNKTMPSTSVPQYTTNRSNTSVESSSKEKSTEQETLASSSYLASPPPPQSRVQLQQQQQQQQQAQQQQQQQQQQSISGYFHSFRTQPWSLTLPSVMEETFTSDTDDMEGVKSDGMRSPIQSYQEPFLQSNEKNIETDDNNSKLEILKAMKELILKQQEAIKDLSDENIRYRQQIISYQDDVKSLRDERKETQQRIITLVLQKESYETEAEVLRDEVKSLRHAVREIGSSDRDKIEHFDQLIDNGTTRNVSHTAVTAMPKYHTGSKISALSPMNRSAIEEKSEEGMLRCSSSSSLSSYDNIDNMAGLHKPSFYSAFTNVNGKIRSPRHRHSDTVDDDDFDNDYIHEESHEVMIVTNQERDEGRDDVDFDDINATTKQNIHRNDEGIREVLVLGEKYAMKKLNSNISGSNISVLTPEWGAKGATVPSILFSGGRGLGDDTYNGDSKSVSSSAAEEVATFKSRLGSIQRRRITRQQSKQTPKNNIKNDKDPSHNATIINTTNKTRSPVVRFNY